MFSSNYFSSASFDFNETRIVLINCYVPIIIKFDTTFYICNNTMTAPKRPAPKCPRAQTAAPKRRRPEVAYPLGLALVSDIVVPEAEQWCPWSRNLDQNFCPGRGRTSDLGIKRPRTLPLDYHAHPP